MKSHKSIRLKKDFLMDRLVKNAVRRRQHDVESVLKLQKISSLNSANAQENQFQQFPNNFSKNQDYVTDNEDAGKIQTKLIQNDYMTEDEGFVKQRSGKRKLEEYESPSDDNL